MIRLNILRQIAVETVLTASGDNAVTFEVIDHIGAGAVSEKELGPYEAVRIKYYHPHEKGVSLTCNSSRFQKTFLSAQASLRHPHLAIRASDSKTASGDNAVTFEVIDHIGAGAVSEKELGI
jgi:molybdopterin biosynthesis enzyme